VFKKARNEKKNPRNYRKGYVFLYFVYFIDIALLYKEFEMLREITTFNCSCQIQIHMKQPFHL